MKQRLMMVCVLFTLVGCKSRIFNSPGQLKDTTTGEPDSTSASQPESMLLARKGTPLFTWTKNKAALSGKYEFIAQSVAKSMERNLALKSKSELNDDTSAGYGMYLAGDPMKSNFYGKILVGFVLKDDVEVGDDGRKLAQIKHPLALNFYEWLSTEGWFSDGMGFRNGAAVLRQASVVDAASVISFDVNESSTDPLTPAERTQILGLVAKKNILGALQAIAPKWERFTQISGFFSSKGSSKLESRFQECGAPPLSTALEKLASSSAWVAASKAALASTVAQRGVGIPQDATPEAMCGAIRFMADNRLYGRLMGEEPSLEQATLIVKAGGFVPEKTAGPFLSSERLLDELYTVAAKVPPADLPDLVVARAIKDALDEVGMHRWQPVGPKAP